MVPIRHLLISFANRGARVLAVSIILTGVAPNFALAMPTCKSLLSLVTAAVIEAPKVGAFRSAAKIYRKLGKYLQASNAFEQSGDYLAAVEMALAGEDFDRAFTLSKRVTGKYLLSFLAGGVSGVIPSSSFMRDPYIEKFFEKNTGLLQLVVENPNLADFLRAEPSTFDPNNENNFRIWNAAISIPKEQENALEYYQGILYDEINRFLRAGRNPKNFRSPICEDAIKNTLLGLIKRPSYDGVVFRRTAIEDETIRKAFLIKGNVIIDPAFVSATYDGVIDTIPEDRAFWSKEHTKPGGLFLIIKSKSGRLAAQTGQEAEVIFPPRTPMLVRDVVTYNGIPYVFLEEI